MSTCRRKTNDLHIRKQTWETVSPFQRGYVQVPCLFSGVYWIWGTTGQKSVFVFYISHEFPMNIQIFSGSKQRRFFKCCFPFEILKTIGGAKPSAFPLSRTRKKICAKSKWESHFPQFSGSKCPKYLSNHHLARRLVDEKCQSLLFPGTL